MLLIITHPAHLPGETLIWQQLLNAGADAVLLRKPGWQEDDYVQALEQTDPACYQQIIIAKHWPLYQRFGLLGVHYSESVRNSTSKNLLDTQRQSGCLLSTGIHNTDPSSLGDQWDLLLMSPVFDSISKPGYQGQFNTGFQLQKNGNRAHVLALGGIDHTNAALARQMGFDGIALLGAVWKAPGKAVEHFHYIKSIWNGNAHT
jgi:thiamine-phosphate pyrophosphorylase